MSGACTPYKRNHASAGGFTLVELILAGAIGAMVIVAAASTLMVAMKSHAARRDVTGIYEIGTTALDIMHRDLLSVFLAPADARTRFVAVDYEEQGRSMDQLIFMSTGYPTVESMGGESDLMEVHYYIDTDPSTEERWLQRRIDATPDDDPFTGGTNSLLGPHVASLDFQFYDGTDWWPSWDSKEEIPVAVSISLGVLEEKPSAKRGAIPDEEPTLFNTMVWMPVYRASGEGSTSTAFEDETGQGQSSQNTGQNNSGGGR